MENEIKHNLVFMINNLTDLTRVLAYLIQCDIISTAENEEIESGKTPNDKNYKLLCTLQTKDLQKIRTVFLELLNKTNNERCAQAIQERNDLHLLSQEFKTRNVIFHPKINQKWWPEKKLPTNSLLKRKFGEKILIDELHDRILMDENRMVVICESPAASKYSETGGVGKTLTAKWYANTYEQEYDHIIWIDCGEGNLLASFKNLSRNLNIPSRNALAKVQDYATDIFDVLSRFKCLWIYDNAENCKEEKGILNVLPKDKENFYCIITSRSREWGTEKGLGKMSDLELEIFNEEEILDFFKFNLNSSIEYTELEIKELCRLMGNLPIALQLTLAVLNGGEISLKSYLKNIKHGKVIETQYDDYERAINNNVKITLELISKEYCGIKAQEILLIFGYIRPDDIDVEFFMAALNFANEEQLKEAIKVLKKYSLVSENKMQIGNEIKLSLSVHRFLQQVIRYNGREIEKETLKKILACVGFVKYKILPFTKYVDEEMRKEFPKVRAELLGLKQLSKLLRKGRFEESVELSRFIYGELKTKTTKFNYGVCLHKNGQNEKCMNVLKELSIETRMEPTTEKMAKTLAKMLEYLKTIGEIRINVKIDLWLLLDLRTLPTEKEIGDPIFYFYLDSGNMEEALNIGLKIADETHVITILRSMLRQSRFKESVQLAKIIAEELKTQTSKFNLAICLAKHEQLEDSLNILIKLEKQEMCETKDYSYVASVETEILELREELSQDLIWGHLLIIYSKMDNRKNIKELLERRKRFQFIYSPDSLGTLIRLVHSDLIKSNYSLVKDSVFSYCPTIKLELGGESSKIELGECLLDLSYFDQLSPEELKLKYVSFNRNGRKLEEANFNKFCDFDKINKLSLSGDEMSIQLSGKISLEYLHLCDLKMLILEDTNWNIQKLELNGIPLEEKKKMNIKEIKFSKSTLAISCLPPTIEKLYLERTSVFCNELIDFPNLKYLTLKSMSDFSFLSSFRSPNLTA